MPAACIFCRANTSRPSNPDWAGWPSLLLFCLFYSLQHSFHCDVRLCSWARARGSHAHLLTRRAHRHRRYIVLDIVPCTAGLRTYLDTSGSLFPFDRLLVSVGFIASLLSCCIHSGKLFLFVLIVELRSSKSEQQEMKEPWSMLLDRGPMLWRVQSGILLRKGQCSRTEQRRTASRIVVGLAETRCWDSSPQYSLD